jgi:hypothetical protein
MSEGIKFEECMQSSPDAVNTTATELEAFRARKIAMITGISGQVKKCPTFEGDFKIG